MAADWRRTRLNPDALPLTLAESDWLIAAKAVFLETERSPLKCASPDLFTSSQRAALYG